ncbi:hypothetical protein [Xanthomonas sacchari]|uniref:hypothetical protein n=1 Tax=Xanthomonas sacchari TaxID=56458 RepID=UPI0022565A5C|nr:hypothetical protein [Xanthomonas sacchari]
MRDLRHEAHTLQYGQDAELDVGFIQQLGVPAGHMAATAAKILTIASPTNKCSPRNRLAREGVVDQGTAGLLELLLIHLTRR